MSIVSVPVIYWYVTFDNPEVWLETFLPINCAILARL